MVLSVEVENLSLMCEDSVNGPGTHLLELFCHLSGNDDLLQLS